MLNALNSSTLVPNTTRDLPGGGRQKLLFQSLRVSPRGRDHAPLMTDRTMWSKNGRPVKGKTVMA